MTTDSGGSAIPLMIDALVDAFEGAAWPDDVEVYDGPLEQAHADAVVIGDTFREEGSSDRQWVAIGARTIDETFTVGLAILVESGQETAKLARDRAFACFDEMQRQLREVGTTGTRVTLAATTRGVQITSSRIIQPEHSMGFDPERGHTCRIATGLTVTAKLRIV